MNGVLLQGDGGDDADDSDYSTGSDADDEQGVQTTDDNDDDDKAPVTAHRPNDISIKGFTGSQITNANRESCLPNKWTSRPLPGWIALRQFRGW